MSIIKKRQLFIIWRIQSLLFIYRRKSAFGICLPFTGVLERYFFRFIWWDGVLPFFPSDEYSFFGYIFLFLSIQWFYFGGELTEQIISVLGFACTTEIFFKK